MQISKAFLTFQEEAPEHASAWASMISTMSEANALDDKTASLVYIGVLAALGIESGIGYHVSVAKKMGATKKEIISAALVGLPPAGHKVTSVLPAIVEAYG